MITYEKLLSKMKEKKITSYTVRKTGILGQATYKKIVSGGEISTKTISRLCEILDCQPGDILTYVPDDNDK